MIFFIKILTKLLFEKVNFSHMSYNILLMAKYKTGISIVNALEIYNAVQDISIDIIIS